jgi:hypothetical protein
MLLASGTIGPRISPLKTLAESDQPCCQVGEEPTYFGLFRRIMLG